MTRRTLATIAFAITIIIFGVGGYFVGVITTDVGYTGATEITDEVFLEVLEKLMSDHYSQPSRETLLEGAIDGMIAALEDPHTSYFDYEEYAQFQSNFGETYVGIGVTVIFVDNLIIVEDVKDGGPADDAGIRPNDVIAFVDGEDIRENAYYDTISRILGDEGTDVTIGIIRPGVEDVIYLTMTRSVIDNSSVNTLTFTSGSKTFGYIEVTTFGDETYTKFQEAIDDFEDAGIDGLIIDLRNNGGGHLSTVYNMMRAVLVDNGKAMFSTEYYSNGEYYVDEYYAVNDSAKTYNIVTLVNEFSASASEVFASGMQEQGGYTLVGTTTYGKGTMQTDAVLRATLNDRLHISIGKWITSDGNWVHFNGGSDGVTPDIIVEPNDFESAYKLFLFNDETFTYDQVDDRIANMQLILQTMGYDVRSDGYFDQATKDAIIAIQTANSLTADGVVTNDVLQLLNEALDLYQDDLDNDTQLAAAIQYLVDNPTP